MRSLLRTLAPPLAIFLTVSILAEKASDWGWVAPYLLPPPSRVLQTIGADWVELGPALWQTASAALLGFALSVSAGVLLAVVMSSSRWAMRAFFPYALFFQTVPIIAIAPLLVIWFGTGRPTVVASTFIVSIFPVIANTLAGLRSTDAALLDLFRLYRGTGWATLWKLRMPAATPGILTGLRIAAGLAVVGAIVGEFVGGGGLGSVVDQARTRQRIDLVFAAVLLASMLGLALFALVNLLSYAVLKNWHASEQAR